MKKIFRMMLLLTMMTAACVSMGSCNSNDDAEPEYVPMESTFSKLLKEKPVHHLSYSQNYGKGYFALYSDPMMGNYKTDYYVVCFSVYNAPADDMYDGRYEVEQADGSLWGVERAVAARIQEERTKHMGQQSARKRCLGRDKDS